MAYDSITQKVIAPVSMADVKAALNAGSLDLGSLCQNINVNKWSRIKPVRSSVKSRLTDEQMMAIKCGLTPVKVAKLLSSTIGITAFGGYTENQCLAEVSAWNYHQPRGKAYNEWYRLADFNGYNHKAVAPDSGWSQKTIDTESIVKLGAVTVDVTASGDYAGSNFKMAPQYNGSTCNDGLYSSFAIRFGSESGESIGDVTGMDIPIKFVTSLDGHWRLALAVWIPNFGSVGGWGIFASRMTVSQYFSEGGGSGTELRNLFPDLATNPYVATLMASYLSSNNGYVTFNAVPLLIKNVGYLTINGKFCLVPTDGITEAYCMPSGMTAIPLVCGTPPAPVWYEISYTTTGNAIAGYITNIDSVPHTFAYTYIIWYQGEIYSQSSASVTLAAGEKRQVAGAPAGAGYGLQIKVISQQ